MYLDNKVCPYVGYLRRITSLICPSKILRKYLFFQSIYSNFQLINDSVSLPRKEEAPLSASQYQFIFCNRHGHINKIHSNFVIFYFI